MRKTTFVILASAALSISTANADLVYVDVVAGPFQNPDGLHDTWRVIAAFSQPDDQLATVFGLDNGKYNPLTFEVSNGELLNQTPFAGSPLNDFPSESIGGEPWDTYVTIGATDFPHNIAFTPDFAGDFGGQPPNISVIEGCRWEEDNGSWFYFGAPPTVDQFDSIPGNGTYDVVIAQFTVDAGAFFILQGNLGWISSTTGIHNTPFKLEPLSPDPCPWDLNGDSFVNTQDLLIMFANWGSGSCEDADFDENDIVNTSDLLVLFANWGPCPE